ncbi:MAG: hypothetical protein ABI901_01620 [Roseiflexaceae bacterium]
MAVHLSEQSRADYSDYLKRFQEDPHSISTEEAVQRYKELVSHAPPELATEANQHVMGLLPQSDREVLASNIHGSQQNFNIGSLLGKDSFLNTPLGKMVLSAAVAYLANRMLGQPQGQVGTRAPSGGLGDLISSILSGAAGQSPAGSQAPSGSGLPGGLGDILGALGGAQAQAGNQAPPRTSNQAPADGGLPGGLGDILGALLGGQPQSGTQAPAGGLPSGLGDILGGLLGGSSADAPAVEPGAEEQPPIRTHRKP